MGVCECVQGAEQTNIPASVLHPKVVEGREDGCLTSSRVILFAVERHTPVWMEEVFSLREKGEGGREREGGREGGRGEGEEGTVHTHADAEQRWSKRVREGGREGQREGGTHTHGEQNKDGLRE